MWAHRIMLETLEHGDNAFITLTYKDEELVKTEDGFATLDPVQLRNWVKRIRKSFEPRKLRFFAVGEYGDKSERPHYHVALFGYPSCLKGMTDLRHGECTCCSVCSSVQKTWKFGAVHIGRLEMRSAMYLAGYVLKKMTHPEDMRLGGRYPEFARMSLRPWGIGASALDDVASVMMQYDLDVTEEDVPNALNHGRQRKLLGRYMRQQLRKRIGRDEKAVIGEVQKAEMQGVRARAIASKGNSVARQYAEEAEGRIRLIRWKAENLGKRRERL